MRLLTEKFLKNLKDPRKKMALIRSGLKANGIEDFLIQKDFLIEDVLKRLGIPASTYFERKKSHKNLDAYTTEKFIRLISTIMMASTILGNAEAKNWLYRKIPSLGNEAPIDLLDTEVDIVCYASVTPNKHVIWS